ncbi:ATP-binding protein, partial [Bacteroidota bacterium]
QLQTNNPISEYNLSIYYKSILSDTIIHYYLIRSLDDANFDDSIQNYLSNTYLSRTFPEYSSLSTVCTEEKILDIQPEGFKIPCFDYFTDLKTIYGDSTSYTGLYTIKNNESSQYLIEFPVEFENQGEKFSFKIFSELLFNNTLGDGLGYPELLIDSRVDNYINTSQLSYAKYYNNNLIYEIGKFDYNISSNTYAKELNDSFFNYKGYKHYIHKSGDYTIIISSKEQGIIERLSTFSFLLIFFLLFIFLYSLIFVFPYQFTALDLNYRNKLQVSIILIILFVFVLIGSISISYMINLYEEKNSDFLKEKTHSVLIELEHKLSNEPDINPDQSAYLSSLLEKFSLVFFSDINLYDLDGKLIATSRPQVFEMSLISDFMNPSAFEQLSDNKDALYIHNEQIGTYNYLSAYTPFRNIDNKIVAYLNLPYFARQTELRHEISIFLTTFINVYILFVAIAIVISLIISRYTTRPLQLLKEKLANLSIDKSNEKIEWKGRDEIGKLVAEYNRMVEELGKNAELLAQSERESAWREMAKQVAHEIKNPLTPMKLSVQYLEKAWKDKSPDWEQRLKRFTKTIVEQIDSLSMIASEFSDFAKMPAARVEDADLKEVIQSGLELYRDYNNITINFKYNKTFDYSIKADKKQLLRVFNNLIKNSTQALSDNPDGKIDISLTQEADNYHISIRDNGPGIPEEISNKIFSPNFTTKTSGMGLGLAIVNSIIESYGGSITFESEVHKGTVFHIKLPV